ncbi:hypothetical protein AMELA_G00193000 [Ameiurus melas]|uniref:Uncharacterized protein n=1 Tax=Ameiurus melas TaxID=219545 RepID=A0A7J6A4S5_AMEME|nr:hypothetical protein AMELA_G00193000 [Ameiurus melas]
MGCPPGCQNLSLGYIRGLKERNLATRSTSVVCGCCQEEDLRLICIPEQTAPTDRFAFTPTSVSTGSLFTALYLMLEPAQTRRLRDHVGVI